jgi:cell division protease FtsH
LDPALLRPGRFDRVIIVNLPDIAGREAILKVHTRKIKLSPSVDLKSIAQHTSMFSGADIANLCNEAALLAARHNKEFVEQADLEAAIERVIMGPEKKSKVMTKREKELTAYHEAGHALLSLLIPEVDPVTKVSIIPRGMAGGYTLTPPREDKRYHAKKELLGNVAVLLGGRVSEELFFGDITTGAGHDIETATQLARQMVCDFGMSDKLGNITLGRSHGPVFLGRDIVEEKNYSDDTARIIDEEVKLIVDNAYLRAKQIVSDNSGKLKTLAGALIEKEVLSGEQVKSMLGIEKALVNPS